MAVRARHFRDFYSKRNIKKYPGLNIYKIKGIEFSETGYVAM
jgi:hypothetical protein